MANNILQLGQKTPYGKYVSLTETQKKQIKNTLWACRQSLVANYNRRPQLDLLRLIDDVSDLYERIDKIKTQTKR